MYSAIFCDPFEVITTTKGLISQSSDTIQRRFFFMLKFVFMKVELQGSNHTEVTFRVATFRSKCDLIRQPIHAILLYIQQQQQTIYIALGPYRNFFLTATFAIWVWYSNMARSEHGRLFGLHTWFVGKTSWHVCKLSFFQRTNLK